MKYLKAFENFDEDLRPEYFSRDNNIGTGGKKSPIYTGEYTNKDTKIALDSDIELDKSLNKKEWSWDCFVYSFQEYFDDMDIKMEDDVIKIIETKSGKVIIKITALMQRVIFEDIFEKEFKPKMNMEGLITTYLPESTTDAGVGGSWLSGAIIEIN
jgi:hypothetical protein